MSNSGPKGYRAFLKELAIVRLNDDKVTTDASGKKKKVKVLGNRRDLQDKKEVLFSYDRRFIKEAVDNQFSIINGKFPGVDRRELVESIFLILDKFIPKFINGSKYTWLDRSRGEFYSKNTRALQDLVNQLKKDVRQFARNTIEQSKRKVEQEKAISISVVFAGTDPRFESEGGDLIQTDLKAGIIVNTASVTRRLDQVAKKKKQGIQIGHTFGPGVADVSAFTGIEHDNEILTLFKPDVKLKLKELRDEAINVDARMDINLELLAKTGKDKGEITITILESTKGNQPSGGALSSIAKQLRTIIDRKAVELIEKYSSSPTIIKRYELGIEELFLTGKTKSNKFKRTYKVKVKGTRKVPLYSIDLTSSKYAKKKQSPQVASSNIQQIIDLLNIEFHDKIRENMGKGRSKQILNYRTGRFAKSAKVINLLPSSEKKAIIAHVKYMRNPYGVFEKGGRLNPPVGRDPKKIFARSLRQILQEKKIATLRRVQVELSG